MTFDVFPNPHGRPHSPVRGAIFRILADGPLRFTQLHSMTGASKGSVSGVLSRMVHEGSVVRVSYGVYKLAAASSSPPETDRQT